MKRYPEAPRITAGRIAALLPRVTWVYSGHYDSDIAETLKRAVVYAQSAKVGSKTAANRWAAAGRTALAYVLIAECGIEARDYWACVAKLTATIRRDLGQDYDFNPINKAAGELLAAHCSEVA